MSKLIKIILGLILLTFVGSFSYYQYSIYQAKKRISGLLQQNLKIQFWPSVIQPKFKKDSVWTSWVIGKDSFVLSWQKDKYAINVFTPEQKFLNSTTASEIFKSYFNFSPEKFRCSSFVREREEITSCNTQANSKFFFVTRMNNLDTDKAQITLSLLVGK